MFDLKLITVFFLLLVAGAAADDAGMDLSVFEGGNLTVFTATTRLEDEPQIMFSLLNGTSDKLIAQLFCHDQKCEAGSHPAVFIHFDTRNVTVAFVNASRSQTGLYKVLFISRTHTENTHYNVTVLESTQSTNSQESPASSTTSKPVTAVPCKHGICAAVSLGIFIIISVIIGVRYLKRKKKIVIGDPHIVLET